MVYSLEALRRAYQQGERFTFLFFWGSTPPVGGGLNQSCLSQWWMQPFCVDGTYYSCAEQYMMAEKARLFQDNEMLVKIMEADAPKKMKAYGRAVRHFDGAVWSKKCYEIVKMANQAKFGQNAPLLTFLLGTRGRILVEASPHDHIWGIGMGKSDPDVENPMKWRGQNLLGFALTEVRDALIRKGVGSI